MIEAIAGIDIGGTKIVIALENLQGERIAASRFPTQVEIGPELIIERMSRELEKMLEENQAQLRSIGIGCPAPLDIEKGLIMSPSNMPGWINVPLVKIFEERFRVPVVLENDANAAALGEYVHGAGRGFKNIVYITVSTGIGGGIVIDGEILHGVGAGAGELGHMVVQPDGFRCNCGTIGCLETICSGTHIARRARERLASGEASLINELVTNEGEITAEAVVAAVRRGDALAISVWDETCRFLAIGVGNIITLLAPEAVIIGGGVSTAGDLLFTPLRSLLPEFVSMVPLEKVAVLQAALGGESGVYGSLAIARRAFSDNFQRHAI